MSEQRAPDGRLAPSRWAVAAGVWVLFATLLSGGSVGAARTETVSELLNQLPSADASQRRRIVEKLANFDRDRVIPELAPLLDDPDIEVQFSVIKALGQLRATGHSRTLIERLKDGSPIIRIASAEALGRLGDPKAVPALIAALPDSNSHVRAQAAKALGNLRAGSAESALIARCSDPDPDVRAASVQALVKLKSRLAAQHIQPLVGDRDEGVRSAARKALRDLRTIWAHIGLVLLAIVPALFMLQRYHRMEWIDPEPKIKVYEAFSLGVASAGLASWINFLIQRAFPVLEPVLHITGVQSTSTGLLAAASVGFIEEGCKFLVMIVFIWRWADFDDRFDGILYSAAVGLGFAAYENLYYVLEFGGHVGVLRAFLAVPVHATCGILMGYFFGLAKWRQLKWPSYPRRLLLYGYLAAAVFHSIWDAIALQTEIVSAIFFLVITVVAAWLRRKVLRRYFRNA